MSLDESSFADRARREKTSFAFGEARCVPTKTPSSDRRQPSIPYRLGRRFSFLPHGFIRRPLPLIARRPPISFKSGQVAPWTLPARNTFINDSLVPCRVA